MTSPEQDLAVTAPRKPLDTEIDVFGVTHCGHLREINQDHFMVAMVHKHMDVLYSSLPGGLPMPPADERLAFVAMVADGVGGGEHGEIASRLAIEAASRYLTETMRCYYSTDFNDEGFVESLEAAALSAHETVLAHAQAAGFDGMATTLTLFLGVWPWVYLLQVGDSRCYVMRNGTLAQVTRDQTMAQDLVDLGVLPADRAPHSRLANVLSSAIGGRTAAPIVTRLANDWGTVHLLCSDGLTKHVTDERIGEVLRTMQSARQACEVLLQEALDGGGSDNITIVIGRPRQPAA